MNKRHIRNISVVISIYNEEMALPAFWSALRECLVKMDIPARIVWVNDGSVDGSQKVVDEIIKNEKHSGFCFETIEFTKNFGHEAAMIAGIDCSEDDVIVCMDADLQHPPDKLTEMVEAYKNGSDVVTMVRKTRGDQNAFMRLINHMFYNFLNHISETPIRESASDFFLISKSVAEILKSDYRERNRFLRGYIQSLGFSATFLTYSAPARIDGKSNYTLKKLVDLAVTAVFSFSNTPLHLSFFISMIFMLFTSFITLYSIWQFFFGSGIPSGYTTLIVFQSVCFTIVFFIIGVLSIYFGKIVDEIRGRPIYIVKRRGDARGDDK